VTASFRYRAANASGDVIEGVVQAATSREAVDALRRQTLVPVSVEPVGERLHGVRGGRRPRGEALATALRTLATLAGAGIPLDRALQFSGAQASHPEVAEAVGELLSRVREGAALSAAMRQQPVFGAFTAAVVRAGEESGTLDEALARLADHHERTSELASQLRAALLYPLLMGIVAGLGVVVLLTFVVPRFVAMLGEVGGTLPLTTRLLVGASDVVVRGWWVWLPIVAVLVLFTRAWLSQTANRRRWHAARLRWPVAGELELEVMTARFARALGVLLHGGTSALAALRVAREGVTNDAMGARIDEAATAVGRGERIAEALGAALPPLATQLFAAGEESGKLDEMCTRVAETYERQSERRLRTIVRLVEPALIIGFGGVVGFIALAMLQAVYSINAGIG
jgi:type II secretory pathway component PulF